MTYFYDPIFTWDPCDPFWGTSQLFITFKMYYVNIILHLTRIDMYILYGIVVIFDYMNCLVHNIWNCRTNTFFSFVSFLLERISCWWKPAGYIVGFISLYIFLYPILWPILWPTSHLWPMWPTLGYRVKFLASNQLKLVLWELFIVFWFYNFGPRVQKISSFTPDKGPFLKCIWPE